MYASKDISRGDRSEAHVKNMRRFIFRLSLGNRNSFKAATRRGKVDADAFRNCNIYVVSGKRRVKSDPLSGFSNHSYLINNRHVLRIKKPLKDSITMRRKRLFGKNVAPLKYFGIRSVFDDETVQVSQFLTRTKKIVDIPTSNYLWSPRLFAASSRQDCQRKGFDVFERLATQIEVRRFRRNLYERKVVAPSNAFIIQTFCSVPQRCRKRQSPLSLKQGIFN